MKILSLLKKTFGAILTIKIRFYSFFGDKKITKMKTYKIPIIYQRIEFVEAEAEDLQTATENALEEFLSIPDDKYLEDSFEIDDIFIKENYPNEKLDYSKLLQ